MPRRAELPNLNPARLDITHYRGDSLTIRLRVRSQGIPVDVTDWEKAAYIRVLPNNELLAMFQVLPDFKDPYTEQWTWEAGIIRLFLDEPSALLLPSVSVWDFQYRAPDFLDSGLLHVRTLVRGYIYAPADVTYDGDIVPQPTRTTLRRRGR